MKNSDNIGRLFGLANCSIKPGSWNLTKPTVGAQIIPGEIHRKYSTLSPFLPDLEKWELGEICLYPEDFLVKKNGKRVYLRPFEFRVLRELMRHPGKVVTYEYFFEEVWGTDLGKPRWVNFNVFVIRRKLGKDLIETVRDVGYRLNVDI